MCTLETNIKSHHSQYKYFKSKPFGQKEPTFKNISFNENSVCLNSYVTGAETRGIFDIVSWNVSLQSFDLKFWTGFATLLVICNSNSHVSHRIFYVLQYEIRRGATAVSKNKKNVNSKLQKNPLLVTKLFGRKLF